MTGLPSALLLAGVVCVVLALPYLATLIGPGAGGSPLVWTVRPFMMIDLMLRASGWRGWQLGIANLLLLPVNYFLELGVFFAVGWMRWRAWRRKHG